MSVDVDDLVERSLDWLVATAYADGDLLTWSGAPSGGESDPTLYGGAGGIALALLEAHAHFGDARWAEAALRAGRGVVSAVEDWDAHGLYFGLAGMGFTLDAISTRLGDSSVAAGAGRAFDRLAAEFDGERWGPMFELMGGNAGIALAAVAVGNVDLAVSAVTPYLDTYEATPHGVTWPNRPDLAARRHHISHGTLGVAYGLAATARSSGRDDLLALALAAVADVVARNDAGPDGFLVPHSDPQQWPERIERYSYGWCHGPAGDAQVFRLLRDVTGDNRWRDLVRRCWHTVASSGLPERIRPGFWDSSGRCCGTAGVLALACDHYLETGDGLDLADLLVADLAARATIDEVGARWSNYEFRHQPPLLEPRQGWAMGNAGIARELMRFQRLKEGRDPAYAVTWPDQPAAQPA